MTYFPVFSGLFSTTVFTQSHFSLLPRLTLSIVLLNNELQIRLALLQFFQCMIVVKHTLNTRNTLSNRFSNVMIIILEKDYIYEGTQSNERTGVYMMDLKRNIIDNIKECEIKIGYREEDMNLYYPLESLLELLPAAPGNLPDAIVEFCKSTRPELGALTIKETGEKGRYCIHVPSSGVKYIHENTAGSPFLKAFLDEIFKPGNSVDDIVNVFKAFSDDVAVEKVDEHEWGVFFPDPEIDPYVYYLEQEEFGLQYHRFTRHAYEALKRQ